MFSRINHMLEAGGAEDLPSKLRTIAFFGAIAVAGVLAFYFSF